MIDAFHSPAEPHEAKYFCAPKALMASPDCRVVSVGSNNQWSFEESIFDQTACRVDTLDCTGNFAPPARIRARVAFHKICLGAADKGQYLTWESAMRAIGVARAPTWLKIDCEGCERAVLPALFQPGHSAALLPDQISLELHFGFSIPGAPEYGKRGSGGLAGGKMALYESAASFFRRMYLGGGYFLIHRLDNPAERPAAKGCTEIVLARAACPPAAALRERGARAPPVVIFDPATDWLDASNAPCANFPAEKFQFSDGAIRAACEPWSGGAPERERENTMCTWQKNDRVSREWREQHQEECRLELPSLPFRPGCCW